MRKSVFALLGLLGACAIEPAVAEVQLTLERFEDVAFIFVDGEFEYDDDLSNFRALAAQGAQFVSFNSPGGSLTKALELGLLIRAAGLPTVQIRSAECASACAYAFLGGAERSAMPGSVGLHRVSIDYERPVPPDETAREIQRTTAMLMAYIREMGADPAILELALDIDKDDIRYLSGAEMERYRVVTGDLLIASQQPSVAPQAPAPREPLRQTSTASDPNGIPVALAGTIRHAKGSVALKPSADEDAIDLAALPNGTRVDILSTNDRWFRVRVNALTGYVHQTWVMVDQYSQSEFDQRFIQVKSFSRLEDARAFVRGSSLPLAVVLASNGWYAITVDGTMSLPEARQMLAALRLANAVPEDSYITYGNTYVRKVCCD